MDKTPEEKYLTDPSYHALVDMLTQMIRKAQFAPSEIREAAMFACIRYEMTQAMPRIIKRDANG